MARIYLRWPQCNIFQDTMALRQWLILSCGIFLVVFIVAVFIHSRTSSSVESKSHFLPTVPSNHIDQTYFSYGPNVHYGIVLDCGSSGTRVYVYVWPPHSGNPRDLLNIQQLKDQYNSPVVKKVSPGLDTFVDNPEDASEYLRPLLEFAAAHIPVNQHKETLLYILATAGMRLLPELTQKAILNDLQKDIPKQFDFVISDNNFEVISGKQEGVYAWIAANYALQKFGHGEEDHPLVAVDIPGENGEITQHVRRRTVGMLDMGGGSMQIAYELTANIDSVPKHLIAEFNLGCLNSDIDHTYRVYVTTFLGFGANEARERYERLLVSKIKQTLEAKHRLKRAALQSMPGKPEVLAKQLFNLSNYNVNKLSGESQQQPQQQQQQHLSQILQLKHQQPERRDSIDTQELPPVQKIPPPGPSDNNVRQQQPPPPSMEPYKNIPDPCLPIGLVLPARDDYIHHTNISFIGTGDYHKCQESLVPLLNLSEPCSVDPCSINGVHQPPISFKNSEFYGFSEFWYTMEDVYRIGGQYEYDVFDAQATDFCGKRWPVLLDRYKKGLYKKADNERFRLECFKSAWLTTVLHKGLKFPESYRGLQSVQYINNKDVQWTLGALIHRTRYLPLRDVEKFGMSKFKPGWLSSSHILYNEYLLVVCFIVVVTAIIIYIRRLRLCSSKIPRTDLSRVPSMSYFMTENDQIEPGVRLLNNYTYP